MRGCVLATLFGLMTAAPSQAGSITYTGAATASGSLGSGNFSNAMIAFTFAGDTANVTSESSSIDRINVGTMTVQVAGLGTAVFSGATEVLVNRSANPVDFLDDADGPTSLLS